MSLKSSIRGFLYGVAVMGLSFSIPTFSHAVISGDCANCHTMHNSQNGQPMATYGSGVTGSNGPNEYLTRGTCIGCHAQGGSAEIVSIGPDRIPQVFHTGNQDLAGGNFAYITGDKGSGASDNKGHNIVGLTGADATLDGKYLPGCIFHGKVATHSTGR